jgi:hypothetical protein
VNSSGRFAKLAVAALAVAGTMLLVAGCSTDQGFPAIHDMPAARTETTLTPDQVKEATQSLVSERDHLNTEAQQNQGTPAQGSTPQGTASQGNTAPQGNTASQATASQGSTPVAAANAPTPTSSIPRKKKKPATTPQSAAQQGAAPPVAQQQQYTSGVSAYAKQ